MNYQNYIDLGFEPTNQDSSGEFNESGCVGFVLVRKIDNSNVTLMAASGELDRPKIYINIAGKFSIILETSGEDVKKIVEKLNANP